LCRPPPLRYYPRRMYNILLFGILIPDALILTAAVLLQAGQGGGLASLGGGAGTEQFMGGRQATTLLTKITWWCAGIFLIVSLTLAVMSAHTAAPRSVLEGGVPAPAPVQPTPLPLPTTPAQPSTTPPSNPKRPPHR
jgi:preprotein translocase subunit SecG